MVATSLMIKCRDEVVASFMSLGLEPPTFLISGPRGYEFLLGIFHLSGQEHRIELAVDIPMLYVGDRRLECYLSEEFASEDSLAKGFARRLKRLLTGGTWEGPEE
jgi:hypothetical protein